MSTGVEFKIAPIAGRETVQKFFVALPDKAQNYSNRRVSLNERFSIIERGYSLQPFVLPGQVKRFVKPVFGESEEMQMSKSAFLESILVADDRREQRQANARSKNADHLNLLAEVGSISP